MTGSSLWPVSAERLPGLGSGEMGLGGNGARGVRGLRPLSLPRFPADLPLSPHSRNDSTITCTMPSAELTAAVPVCVQFENRSCTSHNITFKYEKNPIISDINPKKSQIR